jgi:hypothetical protein
MSFTAWSDWYQPADVVWTSASPSSDAPVFTIDQANAGDVRFGLDATTMAAFSAATAGGENFAVGSGSNCWVDDYGNQDPGYGYTTGWSIPTTAYFAQWVSSIEQDTNVKRALYHWDRSIPWLYAANRAWLDPALPDWNTSLWPSGASEIVDYEFENKLFPDSFSNPSGYRFPWQVASSQVVSSSMTTDFDSSWSNVGTSYQVYGYEPSAIGLGHYAMWHTHGSVVESGSTAAGGSSGTTMAVPGLPVGLPTLGAYPTTGWEATPLCYYQFAPVIPTVVAGSPTLPSGIGSVIAMGGNWSVAALTLTLRPARIRYQYYFPIEPPLRLFQRDDAQGLIRSARLGGHTDVGNGPSSLQEQQAPRLPQTGNTYR